MRFLRSNQLAPPAPPAPPRTPDVELLFSQIGLLAALNGALLARAERAEALLADAAEQHADLRPLLAKLGMLAGEALPEVVTQAAELLNANSDLRVRAAHADRDVGLLTEALIGADLAAFENGETGNDNE
jgi:hypothetical protein